MFHDGSTLFQTLTAIPPQGSVASQGRTDWYTTSGHEVMASGSGQRYSPIFFFTFDSARRLIGFSITWSPFFGTIIDSHEDVLMTFLSQDYVSAQRRDFALRDGVFEAIRPDRSEQILVAPSEHRLFTISYIAGFDTLNWPTLMA